MTLIEQQVQGLLNGFTDEYKDQLRMRDEKLESLLQTTIANQEVIDKMVSTNGKLPTSFAKKDLSQEIWKQFQERPAELKDALSSKNGRFSISIDTKTSGILLSSDHVTGGVVNSYSSQPALAPRHLVNFRDLIRTTSSPTGSKVTYRENTVTNSVANQTEGSAKPTQDYAWTAGTSASAYLSATTTFSKQLAYNLPFLQDTLQRELLRDFYKAENTNFFYTAATGATGSATVSNPSVTVDIEEMVGLISNQLAASFEPSFIIIDPAQWRRLVVTKPNDYSLPAATFTDANGNFRIAGVPIIAVPWATSDHALVIDSSQIERLETESLRIEFSYENNDNFVKNMVTARIECFECLNILRPESLIYKDFSNS